ncbi:MAG: hypothetical protein ABEK17_02385 [Candidatus Aenigmatarchaeota archaeon]
MGKTFKTTVKRVLYKYKTKKGTVGRYMLVGRLDGKIAGMERWHKNVGKRMSSTAKLYTKIWKKSKKKYPKIRYLERRRSMPKKDNIQYIGRGPNKNMVKKQFKTQKNIRVKDFLAQLRVYFHTSCNGYQIKGYGYSNVKHFKNRKQMLQSLRKQKKEIRKMQQTGKVPDLRKGAIWEAWAHFVGKKKPKYPCLNSTIVFQVTSIKYIIFMS